MPDIEFGQLQADLPTYQNTGAAANIDATYTYMAGFKLIGV